MFLRTFGSRRPPTDTLDICNPKRCDTYLPMLNDVGVAYTRETHSLMKCIEDTFIGAKNL
jgi:hypothetical protein